jgi:hypothetical protein
MPSADGAGTVKPGLHHQHVQIAAAGGVEARAFGVTVHGFAL